jgi:hypothetical protein
MKSMLQTSRHLTKGDRRLVAGSQRLKRQREEVLKRKLLKYYKTLGQGIADAYSEAGQVGANTFLDSLPSELQPTLLEENTITAGILGDWQMRKLTPKSGPGPSNVKIFEEEIVNQIDTFLLAEATKSVFLISQTDRNISARIIAAGINNGLGTEAVARTLEKNFAGVLGQVRSAAISRTETGIVGSKAQNQGAVNLGAQTKQWIQVADDRRRDIHEAVDGIVLGMNELFFPAGEAMEFPLDVSRASAMNIVNCRCDVLYSR